VLVGHLVFVEQIGHLIRDHVSIARHRHEGDLLARFRLLRLRIGLGGRLVGWSLTHGYEYTRNRVGALELFKCFQRGFFHEWVLASRAGDEIKGIPHGHDDSKIQLHPAGLALRTGNAFHQIGDVGLGPLVPLHIGMDRKAIPALEAGALPFTVRLHGPAIDRELAGLADRAPDAFQP